MRIAITLHPQKTTMKNLFIAATKKTPEIDFNVNGQLKISGSSYPENTRDFYGPIINWLEEFLFSTTEEITINVDLKYINTATTRAILDIITKVRALSKSTVNVAWMYEVEDADMFETGEDLESITNLKFDFIEKVS